MTLRINVVPFTHLLSFALVDGICSPATSVYGDLLSSFSSRVNGRNHASEGSIRRQRKSGETEEGNRDPYSYSFSQRSIHRHLFLYIML
jgi:hypothetical protein